MKRREATDMWNNKMMDINLGIVYISGLCFYLDNWCTKDNCRL